MKDVNTEKKDHHMRFWLAAVPSYAVFFIVLFFSLKGTIASNFRNGGYEYEALSRLERNARKAEETMSAAFWGPEGIRMTERTVRRGSADSLHALLETLLAGPGQEGLSEGLITYIPHGTGLTGVTMKDGMCFVALTKEILGSHDLERAFMQIEKTLGAVYPGLRVALIAEGEIIIS